MMVEQSLREKIETTLIEYGPLALEQLMDELPGHTRGGVSSLLCYLRDRKKIFVKSWARDMPGKKNYPRPLWDHASKSTVQPPVNARRPLPEANDVRLRRRRLERAAIPLPAYYLFKLVNPKI